MGLRNGLTTIKRSHMFMVFKPVDNETLPATNRPGIDHPFQSPRFAPRRGKKFHPHAPGQNHAAHRRIQAYKNR